MNVFIKVYISTKAGETERLGEKFNEGSIVFVASNSLPVPQSPVISHQRI